MVDKALLLITVLFLLLGALAAFDLASAFGAGACPAADCYPWGAEGPAAENWRYASKVRYLFSGLALVALPTLAAAPVLLRLRRGEPLSTGARFSVLGLLGLTAALTVI